MRRILFVVSLLTVLNQVNKAKAADVDNWYDFRVAAGNNEEIVLTDNITVPAGMERLQMNSSVDGQGRFALQGTNTNETGFFWNFLHANSTLSNLIIQDFKPSAQANDFGGVKLQWSSLALKNVLVQNFSNPSGGVPIVYGGVFNISDGSVMKIEYSHFLNNRQYANSATNGDAIGGVIQIQGRERSVSSRIDYLKYSSFSNNAIISENAAHAYGGAIYSEGRIDTLSGDTFNNNSAQALMDNTNAYGGAISLSGPHTDRGIAYITYFGRDPYDDMTFTSNQAIAFGANGEAVGGAVFVSEYGKTEFNKADESWMEFSGNIAQADKGTAKGGAIANYYKADNSVNMYALDLNGNQALGKTAQGGAIYNRGVINEISDNIDKNDNQRHAFTFTGNIAKGETAQGGALYNSGTINTIQNITFSGNKAESTGSSSQGLGGAIYNAGNIGTLANSEFLTADDTIENAANATIDIINNITMAGLLQNKGTISDMTGTNALNSLVNAAGGNLKSSETLNIAAKFENAGTAEISGTLTAAGGVENSGNLTFNGLDYSGVVKNKTTSSRLNLKSNNTLRNSVENSGKISNDGTAEFWDGFTNSAGASITNNSILKVSGSSDNAGDIFGNISFGGNNAVLNNRGYIEKISESQFTANGETALKNTGMIANIVNSSFAYGSGTGIDTNTDLMISADNGQSVFDGAGTAVKANGKNLGFKAENNATIKICGAIDNASKININGDDSSVVVINGNTGSSEITLENTMLKIGGTDGATSDILADSTLNVKSGVISFENGDHSAYKIKSLTSDSSALWHFNIDLDPAGSQSNSLLLESGSGTIRLSSFDIGDHLEQLGDSEQILQLIKMVPGATNAPQLSMNGDKVISKVKAVMNNTDIVAKSFGLYTTDTENDSIIFRGLKDGLAEWSELNTAEDKVFSFVDGAGYRLSRDVSGLYGTNIILQGNGDILNINGKNMLAEIKNGQNAVISGLRVENFGTTENNGALTLNNVSYNGVLLNKSALRLSGTTELGGKLTNSDTAMVDAGAVVTSKAGLVNEENGTIVNNGQLILAADSENNGTVVGAITAGNGADVMTFANNGYISGKTYVNNQAVLQSDLDKLNDVDIALGGLFKIGADGVLNQNISGEGETLVGNLLNLGSGSLSQTGIVTVADGGTINISEKQVEVGTFNLNGTLQLDISSIAANSASYSGGQIIVGNEANIASDAKLRITVAADLLNKGEQTGELRLISGNNVSGAFNSIMSNNRYDIVKGGADGTVIIINKASAEDIAGKVGNRNNRNTAKAWDDVNVPAGSEAAQIKNILNDLSQHDAKEYVSALTKIAPADSQLAMMTTREVNNQINRSIWHRFGRNRALCNTPFARTSAWIEGLGGYAHQNGSFEAAGFNAHTAGYMLGIDGTVDCDTTAGFGYAFNNTKATSQWRNTGIKGHTLFAYAKYQPQQAYLRGTFSYGYADYDEHSAVENVGIKAKYHVQALSAETAAGYEFTDGFIPEAGLRYTYLMPQKYTDNLGQHVQAENTDLLTGFAGMRYRPHCGAIWYNVRPTAYLGMTYDIYNRDTTANVAIANKQYEISGRKLPRWGLESGVGVEVSVNHWDLSVGYDFGLREKYQAHTGMLNARYNF